VASLFSAALQVGVEKAECDTKVRPQPPLRVPAILFDRAELAKHDEGTVWPLVVLRRSSMQTPDRDTATLFM
jgi:hypothetical protein